ncbi:MAG: hypothetical protein AB3N63_10320 [Puniceicoccaceae bacterium]
MTSKGSFHAVIWLVLLVPILHAQEIAFDLAQWEEQWASVETREDLTPTDRLVLQTDIVEVVGPFVEWRNPVVWDWTQLVLDSWESSAALELAREKYIGLLSAIGFASKDSGEALPDESLLRTYYQRGLSIARSQAEEGVLLFHIAASLVRSEPDSLETRRRVEAFIQQSLGALANEPPRDAVHMMLANLYSDWQLLPDGGSAGQLNLGRAAAQCRAVLRMQTAREEYRLRAQAKLNELLEPGIQLEISERFLPQTNIQLTAQTRNIGEVDVELYQLPWMESGSSMTLEAIGGSLSEELPDPANMVYRKSFRILQRNRIDWQENTLLLGDGFVGGLYQVRISGPGVLVDVLMLVSSLDATILPRKDGSFHIWVADVDTGNPAEDAEVRVVGADGQIQFSAVSGAEGLLEIEQEAALNWHEVQIRRDEDPAVVQNRKSQWARTSIPWVIPRNIVARPGESLGWVVVAEPGALTMDDLQEMTLSLQDGSILLPEIEELGSGIWAGEATIPTGSNIPGPVKLQLSDETQVLLSHLERAELLPMSVELSGEAFSSKELLFMDSSAVDVRVFSSLLEESDLPDYIRVVVSTVSRQPIRLGGTGIFPDEGQIVYENIFNIGNSPTVAAYFELSDLGQDDRVSVYRIEILPLNDDDLLGEKHFAVVPYLGQVEFRVDQHLLREGENAVVEIVAPKSAEEQIRLPGGELVLYRETWESRYLHRKRGSIISGDDYLKLPERSLLGSAKTDYRLLEEGFVREEVDRIRVDLSSTSSLPINLEKAGYYNVEFVAGDSDYQPVYPEGPLEVWVIPDNEDLRSFRSDKRRLIVEEGPSGAQEILLLLEETKASVLVDLEYADGDVVTTVVDSESSAMYLEVPARESQVLACRTVVTGSGQTDHLYQDNGFEKQSSWSVMEGTDFGLNPGSDFQLNLGGEAEFSAVPALWSFFPEDAEKVVSGRLQFQQRLHLAQQMSGARNMLSFGQNLPLSVPFEAGSDASESALDKVLFADPGASAVVSLFPELLQADLSGSSELNLPGSDAYAIEGQLPNSIGKWHLTLFGFSGDNRMHWASWPVSTELPIRTFLTGPELVRPGDLPQFLLTVENTTSTRQVLGMELSTAGSLELGMPNFIENNFRPGQRLSFTIPVAAREEGDGSLEVETAGEFSSTASLATQVAGLPSNSYLKLYHLDPSETGWAIDVSLKDWSSGKVVSGAGIGPVLREIWSAIKSAHADSEPLLVALGDWALDSVDEFHGIIPNTDPDKWAALESILSSRQGPGGGWAWSSNHPADPWLSALVLWSLEAFSTSDDTAVPEIRENARRFLEQAMVREQLDAQARLNALRSLAGPAFKIQSARPSRIQAKAFLEFLHARDQLSNAETALLLQVAQAYGFEEEVDLLTTTLNERVVAHEGGFGMDFWDHTLIYFSLGDRMESRAMRSSVLEAAYTDLDNQSSLRGWKTVGGFLNLLGAFLLEGDFAIGGSADMSVSGRGRYDFPLNPDSASGGFAVTRFGPEQLDEAQAQIQLHSLIGSDPLTVAVVGEVSGAVGLDPYPEQEEAIFREFIEQTLLAGSRLQLQQVDEQTNFQPGDTLQLHLSLYVEAPRQFAEFQFSIPAGATLSTDSIQHSLEPSTSDAIFTEPVISMIEQADPLLQVVRMEPLLTGRHDFILSFAIDWAGEFELPAHKIIFPDSSESFSFGSAWRLRVENDR